MACRARRHSRASSRRRSGVVMRFASLLAIGGVRRYRSWSELEWRRQANRLAVAVGGDASALSVHQWRRDGQRSVRISVNRYAEIGATGLDTASSASLCLRTERRPRAARDSSDGRVGRALPHVRIGWLAPAAATSPRGSRRMSDAIHEVRRSRAPQRRLAFGQEHARALPFESSQEERQLLGRQRPRCPLGSGRAAPPRHLDDGTTPDAIVVCAAAGIKCRFRVAVPVGRIVKIRRRAFAVASGDRRTADAGPRMRRLRGGSRRRRRAPTRGRWRRSALFLVRAAVGM